LASSLTAGEKFTKCFPCLLFEGLDPVCFRRQNGGEQRDFDGTCGHPKSPDSTRRRIPTRFALRRLASLR